jgi:hypothetical protein
MQKGNYSETGLKNTTQEYENFLISIDLYQLRPGAIAPCLATGTALTAGG